MLATSGSNDIASLRNTGRGRMRRMVLRFAATLLFAGLSGSAFAQAFTENFDDITLLAGNGWVLQNNSTPVGSTNWFQGNAFAPLFDAYDGGPNAYIAANYNNTGSTGTISNWLMTPNRTLRNGDVFAFHTRKAAPDNYADRLEVRMSTNGASTNVGSGAGATGDFTTLLLQINPSQVLGVYPTVWTQYIITISGLPAPTSGRTALRYFVTSAGSFGTSSDNIGIDNVVYTPYVCPAFTMTPAGALAGGIWGQAYGTTLTQTGALGAPNYAVTAGALPPDLTLSASGSISGSATATGTFNFTVTVNDNSGCSGSTAYSITVVPDVPAAPQNVGATAGDTEVDVTWDTPASDGGSSITGYTATCTDGTNNFSAPPVPAPPVTVTGLTNGTPYACTVTAINSEGPGAASDPSDSVTPKGNQIIVFNGQPDQSYGPGRTFPVGPEAIATSGLAVTYGSSTTDVCMVASGTTVSIVDVGVCTLTADQSGDAAWNAALQVEQTFAIVEATQVLTFPTQTVASRPFEAGDMFGIAPLASSAEPNSGAPIVYSSLDEDVCTVSGTTVTIVGAGACQIAANQAGNDNFTPAAQAVVEVTIDQATQTLTFPAQTVASRMFQGGATFAIAPEASSAEPNSGGPILYSSLDEGVCLMDGTMVIMLTEGTCTIAADQAGDDNFTAAAQVVSQVVFTPAEADLWVEKSAGSARARIGDTVVYTIVVGNDGPADATDVNVLDLPPDRLDPATVVWECIEPIGTVCPDPDSDAGELDVTIAALPEGATVRFELLGVVIPATDPEGDFTAFDNTASVALPQGSGWTDPVANNESKASVQVIPEPIYEDGFEAPPEL